MNCTHLYSQNASFKRSNNPNDTKLLKEFIDHYDVKNKNNLYSWHPINDNNPIEDLSDILEDNFNGMIINVIIGVSESSKYFSMIKSFITYLKNFYYIKGYFYIYNDNKICISSDCKKIVLFRKMSDICIG